MSKPIQMLAFAAAVAACTDGSNRSFAQSLPFTVTTVAELDEPWAMEFLPDGRLLVTEKRGALKLVDVAGGGEPAIGDVTVCRPSSTAGRAASATSYCIPSSSRTASST
jgi:glucose/arabinose dehydrogenase